MMAWRASPVAMAGRGCSVAILPLPPDGDKFAQNLPVLLIFPAAPCREFGWTRPIVKALVRSGCSRRKHEAIFPVAVRNRRPRRRRGGDRPARPAGPPPIAHFPEHRETHPASHA